MKKGSTGKRKQKILPSGKARLSVAKSRIKTILAKAKEIVVSKKPQKKAPVSKNHKGRPAVKQAQPVPAKTSIAASTDLPFSYNQTKLELLVRDPEWAYAYWDFSGETWRWMMRLFDEDPASRAQLRIHSLNHQASYDLDVQLEMKNWYVNLGLPDTEFEAELGLMDSKGRFYSIVRSNRVRAPRNGISKVVDPRWDPAEFAEITQLSGGQGTGPFGASVFSPISSPHIKQS